MTSPNLSEIVTTTLQNRTKKLADNVSRNIVLLRRLSEKGNIRTFGGGRSIVQELEYANNTTYTRYSGYQAINTNPSDVATAAEFPIRQAAVSVTISGLEELQNSGEDAVINLLKTRIGNAERSMENGIDYDMHSDGSSAGQMTGLQALVSSSPTTGTVGNIDRATFAFWRNAKFSSATDGGGVATATNIQHYMNKLAIQLVRGRDGTDIILADNNYYTLYLESLQAIQRITEEKMAGAGFTSLKYFGAGRAVDVVLDGGFQGLAGDGLGLGVGGLSSNTMYFLNTNYIHYRPHRDRNMVPLNPDRFSTNQDAMIKIIGWAGNMTLSNAFMQGVLVA